MKLDLSSMKKVGGDKDVSHFMNEDGHKITVYHKALPILQRKQLEKIPVHKADGGEASDAPDAQEQAPAPAPEEKQAPTMPVPSPGVPSGNIEQAIAQGQKGIEQQGNVAAQLAKSKADIDQQDLQSRQDLAGQLAENTKAFNAHRQEMLDLYKNNQINPNHYVENMSVPGKVATAIGLFLGGWGKNGNPALEWLNNQINRDIEGQKARQDQAKTLLGENEKYFNDQLVAHNATRIAMNDILAHKIQAEADRLGTPQAEAQKNIALSQFQLQNAGLLQQSALRKTLQDHLSQGGGGQGTTANDWANAGYLSPQEAQKEDAAIQAGKVATQQVRQIYADLAKTQSLGGWKENPIHHGEEVAALNAQLFNIVQGADVSHRLNPEEVKLKLEPFTVKLTDPPDEIAKKQQGVLRLIQQSHAGLTPFMTQHAPGSLPDYQVRMPENTPSAQTAYDAKGTAYNKNAQGQWVDAQGNVYNPQQQTKAIASGGQ